MTTDLEDSVITALSISLSMATRRSDSWLGRKRRQMRHRLQMDPVNGFFQQFLTEKDLYEERFVSVGQFSTESGYQMMEQLIQALGDELPTAFFHG